MRIKDLVTRIYAKPIWIINTHYISLIHFEIIRSLILAVTIIGSALPVQADSSGLREKSFLDSTDPEGLSLKATHFVSEPAALPDLQINSLGGMTLHFNQGIEVTLPPPDPNGLNEYWELDANTRARFDAKRASLLQSFGALLTRGRFVFGLHGFVKNIYYSIRRKKSSPIAMDQLNGESSATKGIPDYKTQAIVNILGSIDQFLFNQARLFAASNESGIVIGLAPILEAGALKWGIGGAPASIYISIGYNSQEDAYIFDIARGSERFHSALSAFVIGGLNVQAGIYLLSIQEDSERHLTREGTTFYPPVAPVYIKVAGGKYASMGFSTTLPPVGGDFFTWTNLQRMTSVLTVHFSRLLPKFVRWTWGGLPNARMAWQSTSSVVKELNFRLLKKRTHGKPRFSCREALLYSDIQ